MLLTSHTYLADSVSSIRSIPSYVASYSAMNVWLGHLQKTRRLKQKKLLPLFALLLLLLTRSFFFPTPTSAKAKRYHHHSRLFWSMLSSFLSNATPPPSPHPLVCLYLSQSIFNFGLWLRFTFYFTIDFYRVGLKSISRLAYLWIEFNIILSVRNDYCIWDIFWHWRNYHLNIFVKLCYSNNYFWPSNENIGSSFGVDSITHLSLWCFFPFISCSLV